jgi:hypothetical protein
MLIWSIIPSSACILLDKYTTTDLDRFGVNFDAPDASHVRRVIAL